MMSKSLYFKILLTAGPIRDSLIENVKGWFYAIYNKDLKTVEKSQLNRSYAI